jgi:uncharacterized membrane protein YphA (DoxX/SURF4 family)
MTTASHAEIAIPAGQKTSSRTPSRTPAKALNIGLWVVQGLLAVAFLMAGGMKAFTPIAELGAQMNWVNFVPPFAVRLAGISELLAAFGLILPALTRIKPILTPMAALGLIAIMVPAAGLHLAIGEPIIVNLVLGGLAAFVAWGRFKKAPISPR